MLWMGNFFNDEKDGINFYPKGFDHLFKSRPGCHLSLSELLTKIESSLGGRTPFCLGRGLDFVSGPEK